jgi:dihydroneopterin aldolase
MAGLDRVFVQGIQFYGYHGVAEEERRQGQRFLVDVELSMDLRPAGGSDELSASIDYAEVLRLVKEIGEREQYRLLEALAERVATALLERFPAAGVRVRASKPATPLPGVFEAVGVEISRP